MAEFRWRLAEDDERAASRAPQQPLFDAGALDAVERHVGTGEFRGMEFLHVNARAIINEVPAASRMPFRYTINAYRGCSHACAYCLSGDTPILMADGRTKELRDVRRGDRVYGTVRDGAYRRYTATEVLDHWSTIKPAYRVTLADRTVLVASGDHRFLSGRGTWKHVTGAEQGRSRRPHLTLNDSLVGSGAFATPPKLDDDYRRGYLCGLIRGDRTVGSYTYERSGRSANTVHRFRLALVDFEALGRAREWLSEAGIETVEYDYTPATKNRRALSAIRTSARASVDAVRALIEWPYEPSVQWRKGFLAGIFDAEGGCSQGVLRMSNCDPVILGCIATSLDLLGFDYATETSARANGLTSIRIRGGLPERLRFFHTTDPVITRKRTIDGLAVKCAADLRVVAIESLGIDIPMFDISTGTGDFVANGVISHNCFARPTHEYLGLNVAEDFERKIVVKVNAVERLRAEVASPKWRGDHIAMGTNTDPYQRCEGKYHLTQGVIRVLGEHRNPFSILTKSTLILRDLDLLVAAARRTDVRVNLSIGTLDERVWKLTEPGTPNPRRRVEAVRRLNEAGIPCGVLIAPIIPGLSDSDEQLQEVGEAVVAAGAVSVSAIGLHLRPGVREHWMEWLRSAEPALAAEHEKLYKRAYLSPRQQDHISERVRDIAGVRRGPFVPVPPQPTAANPPAAAAPVAPTETQLGLGL